MANAALADSPKAMWAVPARRTDLSRKPLRRSLVGKPLGRQPLQQNRRRGAEAAEAREEIPHVSKRTTNWIDSNVEILFITLLVKVIEDIVEDERARQIGTLDCSRAGVSIGRPSDVPAAAEGGALRDGTWNDRILTPRPI